MTKTNWSVGDEVDTIGIQTVASAKVFMNRMRRNDNQKKWHAKGVRQSSWSSTPEHEQLKI
jgi:hypothetical protein